jgi:hypothetical protein
MRSRGGGITRRDDLGQYVALVEGGTDDQHVENTRDTRERPGREPDRWVRGDGRHRGSVRRRAERGRQGTILTNP